MGKRINNGSLRDSAPMIDFPSHNLLGRPAERFVEVREKGQRAGSGLCWDGRRGGGSRQPDQYGYGTEASALAPTDSDWSSSGSKRQALLDSNKWSSSGARQPSSDTVRWCSGRTRPDDCNLSSDRWCDGSSKSIWSSSKPHRQ
ncbi:unnamed protein product [Dovyalis caffra]|uniref:Uncharacterized protein n=1 Tax=Dovyalis caffra TaxID=77055 RepID=A0AAV1SML2_9ROSI|nr:unnamed protein product [Dovyalis caffra]